MLRDPLRFILRAVVPTALLAVATTAPARLDGLDPAAVELLRASTDFVAAQRQLTAEVRSSLEVVLTSGQKIQFDNTATLALQRPNRLRAERVGDLVDQAFYYDGKTLTLSDRSRNVYASVTAPGTLEETLDYARTALDIVAPASDLLHGDAFDILMADVSSGFVVGDSVIEGVPCHHLAFRAPHVDWQIWIQKGKRPLPRKLIITTRDVVGAPQFSVVMTKWNLGPKFTAATFAFRPAKDARRIDFVPVVGTTQR